MVESIVLFPLHYAFCADIKHTPKHHAYPLFCLT